MNIWRRRSERARALATRYPATRDVLEFYAALAEWQEQAAARVAVFQDLVGVFPSLLEFVIRNGPSTLAEAARGLHDRGASVDAMLGEYWSASGAAGDLFEVSPALEFFARAALQVYAAKLPDGFDCAWCAKPPLAGRLRPQAEGLAFDVICSMCFRARPHPRTHCAGCSETSEARLALFTTPEFPHLRLRACEACRGYLLAVDLSREPAAIPEVDELSGLPLDLWAQEHGYQKFQPNLAGV